MSTIREKLLDMLSTVQEMRKKLEKADLFETIAKHGPIDQQGLRKFFPVVSERTVRRRIDRLVREGKIVSQKQGRKVVYRVAGNYPQ